MKKASNFCVCVYPQIPHPQIFIKVITVGIPVMKLCSASVIGKGNIILYKIIYDRHGSVNFNLYFLSPDLKINE